MADASHDDMMAALGTETRLRIVRLLLSAHPIGLVADGLSALKFTGKVDSVLTADFC